MASPRRSIEHSPLRPDGVALVGRIAGGDEGALAALYDGTCGLVYGLLLRILGNSAAAEQALVVVYREAWEQAAAYDGEREVPMTWLITIAHGRAIDRLRADSHNHERPPAYLKLVGRTPRNTPTPACSASEQQRIVRSAFAALPPAEQQMIELAYFSGLRPNEIAARDGLSPQSVRAGMRAGMMRLSSALESHPLPG